MITSQDASVQIKLIIMYAIGVLAMLIVLGLLIHKLHQRFNQFTIPIMIITIMMAAILIDVITLP